MRRDNELVLSEQAIRALESKEELAEVDNGLADEATREAEQTLNAATEHEDGLSHAELQSGFSESHVFSFDKYPDLYLKAKEVMRIRKEGKIEIVEDPTVRRPTYSVSANVCFPHLYSNGELSPMDFGDFKLGRYLLKKQTVRTQDVVRQTSVPLSRRRHTHGTSIQSPVRDDRSRNGGLLPDPAPGSRAFANRFGRSSFQRRHG
jgi:hypothetical protein